MVFLKNSDAFGTVSMSGRHSKITYTAWDIDEI
jgi:hypothetical protein